jgi:hypothetical protein
VVIISHSNTQETEEQRPISKGTPAHAWDCARVSPNEHSSFRMKRILTPEGPVTVATGFCNIILWIPALLITSRNKCYTFSICKCAIPFSPLFHRSQCHCLVIRNCTENMATLLLEAIHRFGCGWRVSSEPEITFLRDRPTAFTTATASVHTLTTSSYPLLEPPALRRLRWFLPNDLPTRF